MSPALTQPGPDRRRFRRSGAVALLVLAVLLGLLAPASADNTTKKKSVDKKVEAAQDDLAESSTAVAKAAAALKTARVEIPKARGELQKARTGLVAAQAVEEAVLQQLRRAQAKVAREQAKVDQVLASMESTRLTIGAIARSVYTQGPYAQLELVLDSRDPSDFAERVQSVRTVVKGQDKALSELAVQRADLQVRADNLRSAQVVVEQRRQEAQKQRETAQAATKRAEAAKRRIDALVAERQRALRIADREKAKTARQLRLLEREQARLAALLAGPGRAGSYPTGSLLWPAAGSLSQGVGPRVHPVYGYASCHTGVDISASSGAPIRAAASGRVVATQSGGPYGNHTIIDHGDGLATMYAHQSRFGTTVGARVSKGEEIGYVGSTGYSTGPHLHFEVWIGGKPYDPMGWFGGARTPVVC